MDEFFGFDGFFHENIRMDPVQILVQGSAVPFFNRLLNVPA